MYSIIPDTRSNLIEIVSLIAYPVIQYDKRKENNIRDTYPHPFIRSPGVNF